MFDKIPMFWNQAMTNLLLMWTAYAALHSLLASVTVKRWVVDNKVNWMPAYRLMFNGIAILLVIPPLWYTLTAQTPMLWAWTGAWSWLANGLALLAIFGVMWSSRCYDSSEFIGIKQWREGICAVEDQESFQISSLHRFVRHPWYSLSLVLIWSRDMNSAWLLTASLITLYFIFGSRLEERKLKLYHGDVYQRYAQQVPGLIPRPWRYLSASKAQQLVDENRQKQAGA